MTEGRASTQTSAIGGGNAKERGEQHSIVGHAQLFDFTKGGSNPGEGWEPPNVPRPQRHVCFSWLRMKGEGRAYLKVHGGLAPQCAPSSRLVEATAPSIMKSCYSCAATAHAVIAAMRTMRCRGVGWMAVINHIGSVVYWKCTRVSSRRAQVRCPACKTWRRRA